MSLTILSGLCLSPQPCHLSLLHAAECLSHICPSCCKSFDSCLSGIDVGQWSMRHVQCLQCLPLYNQCCMPIIPPFLCNPCHMPAILCMRVHWHCSSGSACSVLSTGASTFSSHCGPGIQDQPVISLNCATGGLQGASRCIPEVPREHCLNARWLRRAVWPLRARRAGKNIRP